MEKEKEFYIHRSSADINKILKYLSTKIKANTCETYMVLDFIHLKMREFHSIEPYFSLNYIIDSTTIPRRTLFRILKELETVKIINRGDKSAIVDGKKIRVSWMGITDPILIDLYGLEDIANQPSTIEAQQTKKEQQDIMYEKLNEAMVPDNYYQVMEALDNNNQLTKNIVFLYSTLRYQNTSVYPDWDKKSLGKIIGFVNTHYTKESYKDFDYYPMKRLFLSMKDDRTKWNVNYVIASLEKTVGEVRDIPPKLSFADFYQFATGKPLHTLEQKIM